VLPVAHCTNGSAPIPYDDKVRIHVEDAMAWTTPTLVEICIGLEINGYLPAEF